MKSNTNIPLQHIGKVGYRLRNITNVQLVGNKYSST